MPIFFLGPTLAKSLKTYFFVFTFVRPETGNSEGASAGSNVRMRAQVFVSYLSKKSLLGMVVQILVSSKASNRNTNFWTVSHSNEFLFLSLKDGHVLR